MKINEISKKYQISIRTLRYYEEIGLLSSTRNDSNIREFDLSEVERLELILFFKNFNFKLNEIKEILSNLDITTIKSLFQNKMKELNYEINKLNNKKQILVTVLDTLLTQDNSKLNITEFIKEQIYFQKNNERMIYMDNNNHIMIEIGENLIPLANKEVDGILVDSIKKLRIEMEQQYKMKLDLIRIRDNQDDLSPNEYRIFENDHEVIRKAITVNDRIEQNECILSDLKIVLLKKM